MPRPSPSAYLRELLLRPASLIALAVLSIPAFLGAVAYYDQASRPEMDFQPVRAPSALDLQGPTWLHGVEPTAACGEGDNALPARWIVIGWDGADWQFLLPLLEAGKMPHLESLLRTGSYGSLASIVPTLSPAIWTTVATGRTPGSHHILHFYNQQPILERWWQRLTHFGKLDRHLFTNADRRKRAVWNLMSENHKSVLTVGYHNTFPVEAVNGMMVSNYLAQDAVAKGMEMDAGADDSSLAAGLVYPPERLRDVLDIQRRVNARVPEILDDYVTLEPEERDDFLRASRTIDPDRNPKPYVLVHAWAFDSIVSEIAETYLDRVQPDLAMVHFQAVDWASHRFLYYSNPELFEDKDWSPEARAALEADRTRYQGSVEAFYLFVDRRLGALLEHRDESTGVLLLSDHGFGADDDPEIPGGHEHAPPGILVLDGPGIRPGLFEGATVYDILPTLMASMGLPVADDLPGSPLTQAFCDQAYDPTTQPTVASYGRGTPYVPELARPDELDAEVMKQLQSLGYID